MANRIFELGQRNGWGIKKENVLSIRRNGNDYIPLDISLSRNSSTFGINRSGSLSEVNVDLGLIDFTEDPNGLFTIDPAATSRWNRGFYGEGGAPFIRTSGINPIFNNGLLGVGSFTTSSTQADIQSDVPGIQGDVIKMWGYWRAGDDGQLGCVVYRPYLSNAIVIFDLTAGTKTEAVSTNLISSNLTSVGNDIWYCEMTFTSQANPEFIRINFAPTGFTDGNYNVTVTDADFYCYGFQVEDNFRTSVIDPKTSNTFGSRADTDVSIINLQDKLDIESTFNSSFYFEIQGTGAPVGGGASFAEFSNENNAEQIRMDFSGGYGSNNIRFRDALNSFTTMGDTMNDVIYTDKILLVLNGEDGVARLYRNGSQVGTDYTGGPWSIDRIELGMGFRLQIAQFDIYDNALTSTEAISLTS